MIKSKNEKVQKYLNDLEKTDHSKYEIMHELRNIVFTLLPGTKERMMYGGIMFSTDDDFGGIFVRKKHISFEFTMGVSLIDQHGNLEGNGKLRRHLKLYSLSDIKEKELKSFIKQYQKK